MKATNKKAKQVVTSKVTLVPKVLKRTVSEIQKRTTEFTKRRGDYGELRY